MLDTFTKRILVAGLSTLLWTTAVMSESTGSQVHIISAGKGNFMYQPNNVTAQVGDIVSIQFYPTNHSVVQGVYCGDTPNCNVGFREIFLSTQLTTTAVRAD